ncbi:microcystin-dependent protein [Tenacibaculum adriaticum]|uniref:Microcystin-dependent protein n=1 Tax=Tenacibaculum adriaticum TaxID=413713 RepID=A0A5S5DQ33_9FLAO|nr:tail fiber protein [Tenacibaculum adriaticum]TYP98007.1 microcystin-dependent protein [Tenacibaculum adriaticum]
MASIDPLLGSISTFAGNFAPRGWMFCNGQDLPIAQHQALFSLLGYTYSNKNEGNTFKIPDLRGRAPIHFGQGLGLSNHSLGSMAGQEYHTLNILEMPNHDHLINNSVSEDQYIQLSTTPAVNEVPAAGDVPAAAQFGSGLGATEVKAFGPPTAGNIVNGQTISGNAGLTILTNGHGQPHNNMQPYLAVNFIIAIEGLYPSRS